MGELDRNVEIDEQPSDAVSKHTHLLKPPRAPERENRSHMRNFKVSSKHIKILKMKFIVISFT